MLTDIKTNDTDLGAFKKYTNNDFLKYKIPKFDNRGNQIKFSDEDVQMFLDYIKEQGREQFIEDRDQIILVFLDCIKEQGREQFIKDRDQLILALNTATEEDKKRLIDALKKICTPENIQILKTRRFDPELDSYLVKFISALCDFINLISCNKIATVTGKEINKRIYRLFDLADKEIKSASESSSSSCNL